MKKFIAIILSVVFCFGAMITLTGCGGGYDDSALLEKIAKLERDIEEARNAEAIKGDKGDIGPQGPQGEPGINADNTELLQRIAELEALLNPTEAPIYELGEIFTYVSQGLELFAVTVNLHSTEEGYVVPRVKNLNMPGYAPSAFIIGRYFATSSFVNTTFSDTVLPIGGEASGGAVPVSAELLYLGFPTANGAMIPFVIYQIG